MVSIEDRPRILTTRGFLAAENETSFSVTPRPDCRGDTRGSSDTDLGGPAQPEGRSEHSNVDMANEHAVYSPSFGAGSITWDQVSETAEHTQLRGSNSTRSSIQLIRGLEVRRGTNDSTNDLVRECVPKGDEIFTDQHYLATIVAETDDLPGRSLASSRAARV